MERKFNNSEQMKNILAHQEHSSSKPTIMTECALEKLLKDSNKIQSLLSGLAEIFNYDKLIELVPNPEESKGLSKVSKKMGDTLWTLAALQMLADEMCFKKNYYTRKNLPLNPKALGAKYDSKSDVQGQSGGPRADIIAWLVYDEGTAGVIANDRVLNAKEGLALNENISLDAPGKELYKEYFRIENEHGYKYYSGPSSRGAKVLYACNKVINGNPSGLFKKDIDNKTLRQVLFPKESLLLPVMALISAYTGTTQHHTYYEILAGTVGMPEAPLKLEDCKPNLLKILMTSPTRPNKYDKEINKVIEYWKNNKKLDLD